MNPFTQNSFQVIPAAQPSPSNAAFLHQSIIKSFNLNESQARITKQNNNSIPMIQTDLLSSFNPEMFNDNINRESVVRVDIGSSSGMEGMEKRKKGFQNAVSIVSQKIFREEIGGRPNPRSVSYDNKTSQVKVNFSYGVNSYVRGNNAFSYQQQQTGNPKGFAGMNVVSKRANNFMTIDNATNMQRPFSSIQNHTVRPFSNLSQMSKTKKHYPDSITALQPQQPNHLARFYPCQPPLNQSRPQASTNNPQQHPPPPKTHKLGKKFKTVNFSNQTINNRTDTHHSGSIKQQIHDNNSFDMIESPRRHNYNNNKNNISNISIEKSQYVFMGENHREDHDHYVEQQQYQQHQHHQHSNNPIAITIPPQSYVYSHQNLLSNSSHHLQSNNLKLSKQQFTYQTKSPKKIDNRVYLQEAPGGEGSRVGLKRIERIERFQQSPVAIDSSSGGKNNNFFRGTRQKGVGYNVSSYKVLEGQGEENGYTDADLDRLSKITEIRKDTNHKQRHEFNFKQEPRILSQQMLDQMSEIGKEEEREGEMDGVQEEECGGKGEEQYEEREIRPVHQVVAQEEGKHKQKQKSPKQQSSSQAEIKQQRNSQIIQLQALLTQKQQQNTNLLALLTNQQIHLRLNEQYQKLQLTTKLNQIEIKKLKNQIKMMQINEKVFRNNEERYLAEIGELKREVKRLRWVGV